MSLQNRPFPSPPQIWLPSANSFGLDAPNSSSLWYDWDKKKFAKFNKKVQVYIRHSMFEEFPSQHSRANNDPLWVLVVNISEWHLRVPFWRGSELFATDVPSDAAVMMTVFDCMSRRVSDSAPVDGRHTKQNA